MESFAFNQDVSTDFSVDSVRKCPKKVKQTAKDHKKARFIKKKLKKYIKMGKVILRLLGHSPTVVKPTETLVMPTETLASSGNTTEQHTSITEPETIKLKSKAVVSFTDYFSIKVHFRFNCKYFRYIWNKKKFWKVR